MRLTFVISSLAAGGAERVMCDMANYWAARNYTVTLITLSGPDVPDFYRLHGSVKRVRLSLAKDTDNAFDKLRLSFLRVVRLRQAIRRSVADVVLSFMDINNIYVLLATRGLNLRVVVSERVDPGSSYRIEGFWLWLRWLLYRHADVVVAQTEAAADWLDEHCGTRAVVIPNAIREVPAIDMLCKREKIVLAVGRLHHQKGYEVLVRAFGLAAASHPGWRLVILGEGPERSNLQAIVASLGLTKCIDLHGNVDDPVEWMARAALFVMSSRFEGFPNALLEAMAMGAAVISTDCRSGPRELISDGVNGRLVAVDDVERLSEVVNGLMCSSEMRAKLGKNATEVRQRYAQTRIMERWDTLFLEKVASPSCRT